MNNESPNFMALKKEPRFKWFSHTYKNAEDGWSGPHKHIEDAASSVLTTWDSDADHCFIAQGFKLSKKEIRNSGVDYEWEIITKTIMRLELPKI